MAYDTEQLIKQYIKAQNEGDFILFKSLFDADVQYEVKKKHFYESQIDIQKTSGNIVDVQFLSTLQREHKIWLLFKTGFDASLDEFLLTVVINKNQTTPKALGIWLS